MINDMREFLDLLESRGDLTGVHQAIEDGHEILVKIVCRVKKN